MTARILIVGQGVAGTALGLELEDAGVEFLIVDDPHHASASRVAAGLVNPVTGQRFVKSARVDELLPFARAAYRAWETKLGVTLWHELELVRLFADDVERGRAQRKFATGELAPYVAQIREDGLVLSGAARVDLPTFLDAAARRWGGRGLRRVDCVSVNEISDDAEGVTWRGERFGAVIFCTGAARGTRTLFGGLRGNAIKGQILAVHGAGVTAGRAVHRGEWLIGEADGRGRLGATYERDVEDVQPTAEAWAALLAAAERLGFGELEVSGHEAGVRWALQDKLPVIGWHPARPRVGIFGALGSKGSLWAPWLARQWREVLVHGADVPRELDVRRFAGE